LAWEDEYSWHHEYGDAVFSKEGAFIGDVDLKLATDVDVDSPEHGRIMRNAPHGGEGGPHIEYDKELRKRVKQFAEANPKIKILKEEHMKEIMESLAPEFKAYNEQGIRAKISYSQWKHKVSKSLNNRYMKIVLQSRKMVRQPIKKGKLWRVVSGCGRVLNRCASVVMVPLSTGASQERAEEYREALELRHAIRGEDEKTIQERVRVRLQLELYGTPDAQLFANPYFIDEVYEYLKTIPDDEIGPLPSELPEEIKKKISLPEPA